MPQRDHRIDAACATCRQIAGDERHGCEHHGDDAERQHVGRAYSIQNALNQAGPSERSRDSDPQSNTGEQQPLREHVVSDVGLCRSESHADADIARTLHDCVRQYSIDADGGEQQRGAGKDTQQESIEVGLLQLA
jgi:hypothetical protein